MISLLTKLIPSYVVMRLKFINLRCLCRQITSITIVMSSQRKIRICPSKVNTKFFLCCTSNIINIISLSLITWKLLLCLSVELMNYYSTENYNILSKIIAKASWTRSIKCQYLNHCKQICPSMALFVNLTVTNKQFFVVKSLLEIHDQLLNS